VGKDIREMVVFAYQNVIMDPPFTKLDILICRNLLIYLTPELQKKLLPIFHYSLNPGGFLFLGSAETVGSFTELFSTVDVKSKIYRRIEPVFGAKPVEFPATVIPAALYTDLAAKVVKPVANIGTIVDQTLLRRYTPPAVLVGRKGDILYISGRTGKYLEPPVGKANWNIFAMAREGLRYELTSVFQKALQTQEPTFMKGLTVRTDGDDQMVNITVQPLVEPAELKGMSMIIFEDLPAAPKVPASKAKRSAGRSLQKGQMNPEFQHLREELQNTREEMQTSQEELKSANEELQSTNEELQSTNEELTTSKEEMQSMNEELQTVNAELQSKLEDLSRANNDMRNLLDSTDVATLFLDEQLRVRRFTSQASKIFKLLPGDTGRPITDITSELIYPELVDDTHEVLRSLVFKEKDIPASNKRWFMMRIMPYRTQDNRIDGVVITFTDITASKRVEMELRKSQADLEKKIKELEAKLVDADRRLKDGIT